MHFRPDLQSGSETAVFRSRPQAMPRLKPKAGYKNESAGRVSACTFQSLRQVHFRPGL
jgi:hypothetical protein